MPLRLLLSCYQKSHHRPIRAFRRALIALLIMLACLALGCTEASRGTNANSTGSTSKPGGSGNANADSHPASTQSATIDIKAPERYSVAMTISTQGTTSGAPAPMLTQQLSLAKVGADRRWTFVLPAPLGQIVYLEKSGLKYLVLFERKQYVELTPDALGFQLGSVLTPNSIAERLGSRQYEKLGLEPVNGRTAVKYRVTRAADTSTQIDGVIFVDQETGLPVRSELNTAATATKSRVIVEVRDVQLNPDPAQFDVPAGMKKVTQQEARQQVESFASALRPFADIISGTPSAPVARANQSAANKNASRSGR
jgi:outer membrane lipoprotein-sorting protein